MDEMVYVVYIFQFGFNITNQPSVLKINIKLLHIPILLIKQLAASYTILFILYVPNKLFAHLDGHNAFDGKTELNTPNKLYSIFIKRIFI